MSFVVKNSYLTTKARATWQSSYLYQWVLNAA